MEPTISTTAEEAVDPDHTEEEVQGTSSTLEAQLGSQGATIGETRNDTGDVGGASRVEKTDEPEKADEPCLPPTSSERENANTRMAERTEPQQTFVRLDPEITGMIERIAREQQNLRQGQLTLQQEQQDLRREMRQEAAGGREETYGVRVLVKTNESRLDRVFQRISEVMEDQWGLRAKVEELGEAMTMRPSAGSNQTPNKSESRTSHLPRQMGSPRPESLVPAVTNDIESLYASEEEKPKQESEPNGVPPEETDRRGAVWTPGEAWIQHRFGLGTEEALEQWNAAEADQGRRARGQGSGGQRRSPPRESTSRRSQGVGEREDPRRSVTQPHEVGFGGDPRRRPSPISERRRDSHSPEGGSSDSSDESRRGGGHGWQPSRRLPGGPPSNPSSSGPTSDDWDSEFTVLEDTDRRRHEKRDLRRDPKTEFEREQLKQIRRQIRRMVGNDIQYAASYKGVKDMVTIIKYAGQNDNGMFTRWLDHLLMYFQLNRMCGPDNELVRLSAMYNSLEGVAEEWYCDLILRLSKRSWTFEEAVCSLFLTYVFGSAASHAAREFNEVRYSRSEGAREYAQRLKTKARRLARKPDESTMIIRFLAGLPSEVSRRLTLRERLDPTRHRFKHFVMKLHELGEAENVTKTVTTVMVDEQRKPGNQGFRRPNKPPPARPQTQEPYRAQQRNTQRPPERRFDDRGAKGKGPSREVTCFRCQGKGHYSTDPSCPMFDKNGGQAHPLRDRPQLKAARVPEEEEGADKPGNPLMEVTDTDEWDHGSQWESATEGEGSLHSHDDVRLNKISVAEVVQIPGDDLVYLRAMREKVVAIQKENPSRAALQPKIDRPRRSKVYESCLAAYVVVNGIEAFTLFDSGSSADVISPDFAHVSDARVYALDRPVPLQLGTVGSRASINYGTRVPVTIGGNTEERYYLDVVNIDRYDVILGAPSMRRFGVHLDFERNAIIVGGTTIKALLPEEEAALLRGRSTRRQEKGRGQGH